jgi:hypothetical protein
VARGEARHQEGKRTCDEIPEKYSWKPSSSKERTIRIPEPRDRYPESKRGGKYEFQKVQSYRIPEGRKLRNSAKSRIGRKLGEMTEFGREQESRKVGEMEKDLFGRSWRRSVGRIFGICALQNLVQQ